MLGPVLGVGRQDTAFRDEMGGVGGWHWRMLEVISPGEDLVEGVVEFSECEGRYS